MDTTLEDTKLIISLILLSFAILGGVIFFLEAFKITDALTSSYKLSSIWGGARLHATNQVASSTPIFLGLCGLAGSYLLSNVKYEKKVEEVEDINKPKPKRGVLPESMR